MLEGVFHDISKHQHVSRENEVQSIFTKKTVSRCLDTERNTLSRVSIASQIINNSYRQNIFYDN